MQLHEGYVELYDNNEFIQWKKYYMVLYDDQSIKYYTNNSLKNLKGTIDICRKNLANRIVDTVSISKQCVEIKCKNHKWKFRCESDRIAAKWFKAIRDSHRYHYYDSLEFLVNNNQWVSVWPLLKVDYNSDKTNNNNENRNAYTQGKGKILYIFI